MYLERESNKKEMTDFLDLEKTLRPFTYLLHILPQLNPNKYVEIKERF